MVLRGDELGAQRTRLLMYLYNEGAVGLATAVKYNRLVDLLGLEQSELAAVIEIGEGAGLVQVSGVATTFAGTSYSAARFWLAGPGFDEASRLESEWRDEVDRTPKGPIGFPLPDDHDSGSGGGM